MRRLPTFRIYLGDIAIVCYLDNMLILGGRAECYLSIHRRVEEE